MVVDDGSVLFLTGDEDVAGEGVMLFLTGVDDVAGEDSVLFLSGADVGLWGGLLAGDRVGEFDLRLLPNLDGALDLVGLIDDAGGFAVPMLDLPGLPACGFDPAGLGAGLGAGFTAGGAGSALWEGAEAGEDQVYGPAIALVPPPLNPSGLFAVWTRPPCAFVKSLIVLA